MTSWTLRPQATGGINGPFTAADRAAQYVRRHAWQFHGAGVQEAVRDLSVSPLIGFVDVVKNMRVALAEFSRSLSEPIGETAHGLTVVGWRCTKGRVFCPEHRGGGNVPVTSGDLNTAPDSPFECFDCGKDLRP